MDEYGEMVVTRIGDKIRIDRADDRVLVHGELLDALSEASSDVARLDTTNVNEAVATMYCGTCFYGAVLHMTDLVNERRYIYRIDQYDPKRNAWTATKISS